MALGQCTALKRSLAPQSDCHVPQQRCIFGGSHVQLLLACLPCLLSLLFFWWGQGLYTLFDYPLYLCSSAKFILEVSPLLFPFVCRPLKAAMCK